MGGHAWFYFVAYESDIHHALQSLRQREFKAGRYNPAVQFPESLLDGSAGPGAQHSSIEEALEASEANGTRSILDMERIGTEPGYGVVTPLSPERLVEFFGTRQTHA